MCLDPESSVIEVVTEIVAPEIVDAGPWQIRVYQLLMDE